MRRQLLNSGKDVVRTAWRTQFYAKALLAQDRLAASIGRRLGATTDTPYNLLIAPSGGGNLGDQAMFNSIVTRSERPVRAIVRSRTALTIPPDADVTMVALPRAITGMPLLRFPDVVRFGRELVGASALIMPGADNLDGGQPHASLGRLNLARIGSRHSVPTFVQGFSWSSEAPHNVTEALRGVSRRAVLYPRDPLSKQRLDAVQISATQAADVVFTYKDTADLPDAAEQFLRAAEVDGRPVALLNTSGLINRKMALDADYRAVLDRLRELGYAVILVPHVIREPDNDLTVAQRLVAGTDHDDVLLIDQLLTPEQVKTLVSRATIVITGRMHLAIQSLNHATPAITLATVGKVEGLYQFFGLEHLVVQPRPGCATDLITAIETVTASSAAITDQIEGGLPTVRALAELNFEGLTAA